MSLIMHRPWWQRLRGSVSLPSRRSVGKFLLKTVKIALYCVALYGIAYMAKNEITPWQGAMMGVNWTDRHFISGFSEDPNVSTPARFSKSAHGTVYEYIGEDIPYTLYGITVGHFRSIVKDVSIPRKAKFVIVSRDEYPRVENTYGIVANFFEPFRTNEEAIEWIKENKLAKTWKDVKAHAVIAFDKRDQTLHAGQFKDFKDTVNFLFSRTFRVRLDTKEFARTKDGKFKLIWDKSIMCMSPYFIWHTKKGEEIKRSANIGVTIDRRVQEMALCDCTRFGKKEGTKTFISCGGKLILINGSFKTFFDVYGELHKDFPNKHIFYYGFDGGSYNAPFSPKGGVMTKWCWLLNKCRDKLNGNAALLMKEAPETIAHR
jgi:hypothetical protein